MDGAMATPLNINEYDLPEDPLPLPHLADFVDHHHAPSRG
jgi:hypothetical protein